MRTVDDLYHKNVLFVMEKGDKIARLEKVSDGWLAWFYHHRFFYHYSKLSAEDRIMGYLAQKDLLVCSMTDDDLFDLSAFINQEVADVVRKVYDALEKKALQMRPVIITAPPPHSQQNST